MMQTFIDALSNSDAPASVGQHPDASLLTAFVEQSLPDGMKARLLDHLSTCDDCRLTVLLATPPVETTLPVPATASSSSVWANLWNVAQLRWLRLSMAGATIAVMTAIAWFTVVIEHPQIVQRARQSAGVQRSTPEQARAAAPSLPNVKTAKPSAHVQHSPSHQAVTAKRQPPTNAPAPVISRDMINTSVPILGAREESATPAAAKPSAAANAWMVSAAGVVYQSFDGGQNWQSVDVPEGVSVRVVRAHERVVWVGGKNGALLRSTDGGQHWTQVVLDKNIHEDITDIAIDNHSAVTVTTSSGKAWTSADGGSTWK